MTKTAWVFPGQGSQTLGMGGDLAETPLGKTLFTQAEEILGWSVLERCQSDEATLAQTLYTQPCLYVISAILTDLLREQQPLPTLTAGHSLGEYVALYAAQVFNFSSGLRLVKRRAELMDQASGGKMVALIGFDRSELEATVATVGDVVLANDNHAGQVVISGTESGVDAVLAQVKVKRAVPLNVSGAFHSPLMSSAAQDFGDLLNSISFVTAQIPVLSNVDPHPTTDAEVLKQRLIQQMTGPVRWREICLQFTEHQLEQAIEIGPGKVLTGLMKRTCPELGLVNISSLAELQAFTA
jgi:[acyl-carrier-protein] S-malonyltransferase